MDEPVRPGSVIATLPGGNELVVDVVYRGQDDAGIHVWEGTMPLPCGTRIALKRMPARTMLQLEVIGGRQC